MVIDISVTMNAPPADLLALDFFKRHLSISVCLLVQVSSRSDCI